MPHDHASRDRLAWEAERLRSRSLWLRAHSVELVSEGHRLVRQGRDLRHALSLLHAGVADPGVAGPAEA